MYITLRCKAQSLLLSINYYILELMSLALYRKYRSKSFDDVVGQDHITKILQKSIKDQTFSHAYLLTGLRGVGKTSIARIFACSINGISYDEAGNNPDIIEIDAASNRKIDEIRDLREKVNIAPTSLEYKVYIIDEVHMLTREAFNALLKTLEEPPRHCILVLATTDYHKLPETIISRCVRLSFRSISAEDIIGRLEHISKKEKIQIDTEALRVIAENSSGSLRDAITILDQVRNLSDKIKADDVEMLLGLASKKQIFDLHTAFESKNPRSILEKLESIRLSGAHPEQAVNQFSGLIRHKIITSSSPSKEDLDVLSEVMKISSFSDQWLAFEICLLKHSVDAAIKKKPENEQDIQTIADDYHNDDTEIEPDDQKTVSAAITKSTIDGHEGLWQKVLNDLKKTNSTLYGVARMAEPSIRGDILALSLKFNFHKKQLDIKQNKVKIIEIASKHNPDITSIETTIIKESAPKEPEDNYNIKKDISNISNVFGSAEMLE